MLSSSSASGTARVSCGAVEKATGVLGMHIAQRSGCPGRQQPRERTRGTRPPNATRDCRVRSCVCAAAAERTRAPAPCPAAFSMCSSRLAARRAPEAVYSIDTFQPSHDAWHSFGGARPIINPWTMEF